MFKGYLQNPTPSARGLAIRVTCILAGKKVKNSKKILNQLQKKLYSYFHFKPMGAKSEKSHLGGGGGPSPRTPQDVFCHKIFSFGPFHAKIFLGTTNTLKKMCLMWNCISATVRPDPAAFQNFFSWKKGIFAYLNTKFFSQNPHISWETDKYQIFLPKMCQPYSGLYFGATLIKFWQLPANLDLHTSIPISRTLA